MAQLYDTIGTNYAKYRRPDPRIAAAIIAAIGDTRRVVNVGAGEQASLNELIASIGRVTGRELDVARQAPRPGDVRDSVACLRRAAEVLGYEPTVGLDEGLRQTWEWTQRQTGAILTL